MEEKSEEFVYAAVVNIPKDSYRSVDLRAFFNEFVESGKLSCFHFLHRGINGHKDCCVAFVKIASKFYKEFERSYHTVQYYDKHNKLRDNFCVVLPLDYGKTYPEFVRIYTVSILNNGTDLQDVCKDDFLSFREFNPPPLYPNGNVGTSSKYFNELIGAAKLPTNIIKRLELTTSRLIKKYARVRYDYPAKGKFRKKNKDSDETSEQLSEKLNDQDENTNGSAPLLNVEVPKESLPGERLSESRHIRLLPVSFKLISSVKGSNVKETLSSVQTSTSEREEEEEPSKTSLSDSEPEEEWDRRQAIADDPMKLEHNKEIVYESPMEVVWEKGGPGLVWKTDESERRNHDFDEITTDDWDMDMAVYNRGTELCASKDAVDLAEMRKETKNRADGPESAFAKNRQTFPKRMLSKQGWSEGQGLGKNNQGISEALSADGQRHRRGLGYYGEKIIWKDWITKPTDKAKKTKRNPETILIATAYDDLSELDKNPKGDERASHLQMKYRDDVRFPKIPKLN